MNENEEQVTGKMTFKEFWKKVYDIWLKIISFKWFKFIVVGVVTLIVVLLVSINSNTIYYHEGVSKENEVAAFIGIQSESCFYKTGDEATNNIKRVRLVLEGYSSKDAYEKGEASIFDETRALSDEKTVRGTARRYRINYEVREEAVEEIDTNGNKYTEIYKRSALQWYRISVNEASKIMSYRISTFIELTKLKTEKNVTFLVLSFQTNDTTKVHYRNIEIE